MVVMEENELCPDFSFWVEPCNFGYPFTFMVVTSWSVSAETRWIFYRVCVLDILTWPHSPTACHSSLAGPALTFTCLLISGQLIARVTSALVAAKSIHTALLTSAMVWPGALIHLCWGGNQPWLNGNTTVRSAQPSHALGDPAHAL